MCKCTPNIRTPFCGKIGCQRPGKEHSRASLPVTEEECKYCKQIHDKDFACKPYVDTICTPPTEEWWDEFNKGNRQNGFGDYPLWIKDFIEAREALIRKEAYEQGVNDGKEIERFGEVGGATKAVQVSDLTKE